MGPERTLQDVPPLSETPAPDPQTVRDDGWLTPLIWVISVAAVLFVFGLPLAVSDGLPSAIAGAGLEVTPFAVLAALAYLGHRVPETRWLASGWLLGLKALMAMVLVMLVAGTWASYVEADRSKLVGVPAVHALHVALVAAASAVGFLAGLLLFFRQPRRLLARRLPMDPDNHVHATALAAIVGLTVILLGQLVATGSQPVLLIMVKLDPKSFTDQTAVELLLGMLFGLAWSIPGTVVAAGYPVTRSLREALVRLGMVRPTLRQVLGGLVLAGLLVVAMGGLDHAVTWTWTALGLPTTDVDAFEAMIKPAITPIGAVVVAVTAGVGEEMVVRGVLQPRLGILLPNLFFTSLHALQYSWDGLLSVFLIGMVLGVVRMRTNTSTACIVHGTYDFILVLLSYLGVE